jgi:hypothetical protein
VLGECVRLFTDVGFDEQRAGLMFHTAAAWLVGAINQELISCANCARARASSRPTCRRAGFSPGFKEACLAMDPAERFAPGSR